MTIQLSAMREQVGDRDLRSFTCSEGWELMMRRSRVALFSAGVLAAGALAVPQPPSGHADVLDLVRIPGLHAPASLIRDDDGVAHIKATNPHDLFFLQGWAHADDRLFQMDVLRRRGSGTLAELLGSSALPSDVQLRTFGLRRTAERSLSVLSTETQQELRAYADGVNAWTARNKLPSQYATVQVTKVAPWTVVDSLVVNKTLAFSLSFDLDIDRTTAVQAYNAAGLDGHTAVTQDVFPFAPFNTASPVIDSLVRPASPGTRNPVSSGSIGVPDDVAQLAADYLERAEQVPLIVQAMNRSGDRGSNSWVIGGRHTANGKPILASDPHLSLEAPSTLQPIDVEGGGFDFQGESLPGTPYMILGQNRHITYGATQHFVDVTDTYIEKIQPDPASPSGLSTLYKGGLEPIVAIDEKYRVNPRTPGQQDVLNDVPASPAIPARTLIVPRRNNGPLLSVNLASGTGLSVQYVGFSPTTELEAFRGFSLARNVSEFRDAMQYFDLGGQHFIYADLKGNIGYFTNAEVPVREDLQAGKVRGNPPYLLRDGTGGNEWLPVTNPQPNQAAPYEIVPFNELPQVVNPPAGFIVSANNDPTANSFDNNVLNQVRPGGGIAYLGFFHNGFRAGRITDMVKAAITKGPISTADVVKMQADVTSLDGQFFTPVITKALDRAKRSSTPELAGVVKDPRIVEAVGRLARWNFTYPTGIPEGYDSSDVDGRLSKPSRQEIDNSVAATIYALWVGRFAVNVIDRQVPQTSPPLPTENLETGSSVKAIRQLLLDFDTRKGVGRSGIDFFAVPGMTDAADRRDFLVLKSIGDALTLAAGDSFKAAFGNSTNQSDYRWGKLHRTTIPSVLGAPYTIPSQGNRFTSPLPGLPGIPVDGGANVPDTAGHAVRADTPDEFTTGVAPVRRFVAQATSGGWRSVSSLPGGVSEDRGSRFEQNLLAGWLTNDTYPVRRSPQDLIGAVDSITTFVPARG
jgi:penicillin G amidase